MFIHAWFCFFNDTATTESYTYLHALALHDALPISFISVLSGDWVAATLACLSSAAMVGGIAFRNFAAPRLVALMILLSLGPCAVGGAMSGQPILLVATFQIPFYLVSMTIAAFRLNRMLVATMRAEHANRHRARHRSAEQTYELP